MDLTCLDTYPPLPTVPITANDSNTSAIHPSYTPNSGGISQMISVSMARSTFSSADIQSLLGKVFNSTSNSWSASEVVKTAPIPSVITYTSVALGLVFILSIIFYVTSCLNFGKQQQKGRRRQSKMTTVCVCLLVIVYLLGIADMIYVAYRVNQSTGTIDETIKGVNREIYPKEISEHMTYLIKQVERLDQYAVQPNSILINASKSMLVKAFEGVLKEKYFVQDLLQSVNSIDRHFRDLNDTIDKQQSQIPPSALVIFADVQTQYKDMLNNIENPLKKVCDYANHSGTDIDKKLLDALRVVHLELKRAIDMINDEVLRRITPWESHMVLNADLEEQIRGNVRLVGIIFLVLVVVLGSIPLLFFTFIIISRLCGCCSSESRRNSCSPMPMHTIRETSKSSSMNSYRRHYTNDQEKESCSLSLCLMRVAFIVMILMLIAMILLTGVYYALDLTVQGACRSVHDDQPFLINFGIDQFFGSNVPFGNRSEMNIIATDLINDCRDQVPFSRKLLDNFWSILNNDIADMMNTLSKQIFDQFMKAIGTINIPDDIDLLLQFVSQANVSNISLIVQGINNDLKVVDLILGTIRNANATLPSSLVQTTIAEFKDYVKTVAESTVDKCPLPLATIYKADTLVCHSLSGSIGGLWLDVFFFFFLITVGLCIFGVHVYKRSDRPVEVPFLETQNF